MALKTFHLLVLALILSSCSSIDYGRMVSTDVFCVKLHTNIYNCKETASEPNREKAHGLTPYERTLYPDHDFSDL